MWVQNENKTCLFAVHFQMNWFFIERNELLYPLSKLFVVVIAVIVNGDVTWGQNNYFYLHLSTMVKWMTGKENEKPTNGAWKHHVATFFRGINMM